MPRNRRSVLSLAYNNRRCLPMPIEGIVVERHPARQGVFARSLRVLGIMQSPDMNHGDMVSGYTLSGIPARRDGTFLPLLPGDFASD
jgi:hypothetical protein